MEKAKETNIHKTLQGASTMRGSNSAIRLCHGRNCAKHRTFPSSQVAAEILLGNFSYHTSLSNSIIASMKPLLRRQASKALNKKEVV